MKITEFNKKNGSISSDRVTIGSGKNKLSMSSYRNSTRGGVTFKGSNISSRLNSNGQSMGVGIKGNSKRTSYFNTNGKAISSLPSF